MIVHNQQSVTDQSRWGYSSFPQSRYVEQLQEFPAMVMLAKEFLELEDQCTWRKIKLGSGCRVLC